MINIYFITSLVLLSFLPTLASFMNFYEGNVQRLLMLIILTCPLFFLKINSKHDLNELIKYLLKNNLCFFLICTTFISIFHILIERKPTSINYIDIIAPSCLLIYGIVLYNKISLKSIFSAIHWIMAIWICVGLLELLLNFLYGNYFCLPHCIYYINRPNSPRFFQALFGLDSNISLESLGLGTQEFSIILGVSLLMLMEKLKHKKKFSTLLLLLTIIYLQIFSLSFSVLIAETMSIALAFGENKFQVDFKHILIGLLSSFLTGYFLNFHFFSNFYLYLDILIFKPIAFLFNLNWYEILFGLMTTENYPAENRIAVLIFRFGIFWFIYASINLIRLYKLLAVSATIRQTRIVRMLLVYFCLVSVHNDLWHTLSGTLIFSLFIILFYETFRTTKNYDFR